jgi:hypothetical protein
MKRKTRFNFNRLPHLALALTTATAMGGTEEMTTTAAPAPSSSCLDWVKVSGYAAIAYTHDDQGNETFADGGTPFDAVKVGFEGSQGPIGGYVSLFYTPGVAGDEAGILDAFLTYKAGPVTVSAGKYLSYLGYEAFDTVNMTQLTYANATLGAIPAYHNGVKVDYSTDILGAGLSVSDSIRGGDGFWTGDEEFSDDQGYEGYVVYKGFDKLTLWAGFGYENTDGGEDWVTYDFWASYKLTENLTIAGEAAYHDDGPNCGTQGLAFLQYAFTSKFSTVARFGFDENKYAPDNYRYTLAPTYAFCETFLVRGEVTYNDTIEDSDSVFAGVQALYKF